jgi:hypothetical protein
LLAWPSIVVLVIEIVILVIVIAVLAVHHARALFGDLPFAPLAGQCKRLKTLERTSSIVLTKRGKRSMASPQCPPPVRWIADAPTQSESESSTLPSRDRETVPDEGYLLPSGKVQYMEPLACHPLTFQEFPSASIYSPKSIVNHPASS